MLDLLIVLLATVFIYWATVLIVFSFAVDDKKIFWTQRVLAFVFMLGSLGALYVNAL